MGEVAMKCARLIYVYLNGGLISAVLVYADPNRSLDEPVRFSQLLARLNESELEFLRNELVAAGEFTRAEWIQDDIDMQRYERSLSNLPTA